MSIYVITSSRVGEIGTVFEASPSDDIAWLIGGGFIQPQDTAPRKTAKKETSKAPDAAETQE